MRYPGSHKHEKVMKLTVTLTALAIFGLGWQAAYLKGRAVQADQFKPVVAPKTVDSPAPTPTSMATLQIYDGLTKKLLTGQSIVILTSVECQSQPCPTSTPLVLTADDRGRIVLSQEKLRLRPKIYAAGYKLDTYFSFLDVTNQNILTLFEPMDGTKVNYDITLESVPIGLTPVKAP